MTFKLSLSPSYLWPISVDIPAESGAIETSTFKARFSRLTIDQFAALAEKKNGREILREVLIGWEDLTGADDKPLPFTAEAREILLSIGPVLSELSVQLMRSQVMAKEKN
jgi:hypothetical protein